MSLRKQILCIVIFAVMSSVPCWAVVELVSGGEAHSLVLTADGFVWGCGANNYYQLGIGDTMADELYPVCVHDGAMSTTSEYLEGIEDIAAGLTHSLARDENGFVWAWGRNVEGQLGNDGLGDSQTEPVQVLSGEQDAGDPNSFLQYITDISAGRSGKHSLAVDESKFVWAWGHNEFGQLGNDNNGDESTAVKVHGGEMGTAYLEDINMVFAGSENSMALDEDGFVWTWGDNVYGKLGIGSTDDQNEPVKVLSGEQDPNSAETFLQNIVDIAAGWDHCMALEDYDPCDPDKDGRVYTWGRNTGDAFSYYESGGQLGDGTEDNRSTPVIVLCGDMNTPSGYLEGIVAVSAGDNHSMALDANGFVWTWGINNYGPLGNGTYSSSTTPVKVVGLDGVGHLEGIVAISAGYWHSMAVDSEGKMWSWGQCANGQLGLGLGEGDGECRRNTPCPVPFTAENVTKGSTYFKIQQAINHADDGDEIAVYEGTHTENIDFLTKSLTLRSENPSDPNVVSKTIITIIDVTSWDVNVVKFNDNQGSVLNGFTVTHNNGYGISCTNSDPNIVNCIIKDIFFYGIKCESGSSVKIINCVIEDIDYDGIYCNDADVDIIDCNIIENAAVAAYAGVRCENGSSVDITNSRITGNLEGGIYCKNSDVVVSKCLIAGNGGSYGGIKCEGSSPGSNLTVSNCIIEDNDDSGIYFEDASSVSIANNIIRRNGDHGIHCCSYVPNVEIKNNWIYDNGTGGQDSGIYIDWDFSAYSVIIRNNTIVGNDRYGIYDWTNGDPNITNCIIWGNGSSDSDNLDRDQGSFSDVTYSCVRGGYSGQGNISSDPCFMDDSNDFHLSEDSLCIEAGLGDYSEETDIDGRSRVADGYGNGIAIIDIGADEFYWSYMDFSYDGTVNFLDYAMFANAWLSSLGDPNYDEEFDLEYDDTVDYKDLGLFVEEWLWEAGWLQTEEMMMGQGMAMGVGFGFEEQVSQEAVAEEVVVEEEVVEEAVAEEAVVEEAEAVPLGPDRIEEMVDWVEDLLEEEYIQEGANEDALQGILEDLQAQL